MIPVGTHCLVNVSGYRGTDHPRYDNRKAKVISFSDGAYRAHDCHNVQFADNATESIHFSYLTPFKQADFPISVKVGDLSIDIYE